MAGLSVGRIRVDWEKIKDPVQKNSSSGRFGDEIGLKRILMFEYRTNEGEKVSR